MDYSSGADKSATYRHMVSVTIRGKTIRPKEMHAETNTTFLRLDQPLGGDVDKIKVGFKRAALSFWTA
jgi:hypothetical protein